MSRSLIPSGDLSLRAVRQSPELIIKDKWIPDRLHEALNYNPSSHLGKAVREILRFIPDIPSAREAAAELIERLSKCVVIESALYGVVKRGALWLGSHDGAHPIEDYGLLGEKVVTTAGVNYIVAAFQNLQEVENFRFHGIGTGSGAEAISDTALGTELTTQYTGNVRATGSLTVGASNNIFRTVGANLLDETPGAALREHGIFTQAATGGGTLLDRTVYGAITLSSGDTLTSTYELTLSPGS